MSNSTIYDVAGRSGVSLATVSRVLNNPEKVKEETRQRVLKAIKELGYRPNVIARGLASRKTTTVGVVISDITRASVAEMLGGIMDIATKYKYSIKIFSIAEEVNLLDSLYDIVAEQVDGVLFLHDELSEEGLTKVKEVFSDNNISFVFGNAVSSDHLIPLVTIDYMKAAYEVTKMLIETGKKDIYLLSTVRRYSINTEKEKGYEKAMQEAGLESKIFRTSGDVSVNKIHFNEFFQDKKIDAAIGVRDSIAISFMNIAQENGRKIPTDIAVVGFQNTKYSLLSRPNLTSIDIPVYDIGAVAMRLLTKLMNKSDVDNTNIKLPHYIMRRKSTE